MLVLSRRPGEVLRIGDDVKITVLAIRGYQISFGIAAPREVIVDRKEIYDRKHADAAQRASKLPHA